METLHNGFTLDIPPGCFPLSTDSMALAHFVRLKKDAKVLDLGSGCGTLGLLLCASDPGCAVTGVELDPVAQEAALENIRRNGLAGRMESICGDLRRIPQDMEPGQYSCCVSNPPYFSGGPASQGAPLARREDCCDLDALFRSAAWALRYGGDFYLVHRPERLAELCARAVQHGLEPKRLRLLRHRSGDPVSLVLVSCRKGGKPGLIWEEICLFDETGKPTDAYRQIYHI
ncbi:MAG: methyltransferase [Oscillospiraceae bacterium]|nr:methyltransferase [Oscillospiraceae bacterium]